MFVSKNEKGGNVIMRHPSIADNNNNNYYNYLVKSMILYPATIYKTLIEAIRDYCQSKRKSRN